MTTPKIDISTLSFSEIGKVFGLAYFDKFMPKPFAGRLLYRGLDVLDVGAQNFMFGLVQGAIQGVGRSVWNVGANYIKKHQWKALMALYYEEPSINMKQYWKDPATNNAGIINRIWSYCLWGSTFLPELNKKEALAQAPTPCFFNERTENIIRELSKGVIEHAKAERPFQNAIFYGPPGVGKTMVLQRIAQEADVNYMVLSGSSLREAIRSRMHLEELEKIFKKMEKSSVPTILVIDECELLFMDRKIQQMQGTGDSYDLLEAFLKYTGSPSKKFMIVLATNNLRIIDEAILDRMDYQVSVGPPELRERVAIIKANIPLKFREEDQKIWTEQKIEAVAQATESFSGRCLEKLLTRIAIKCDISPEKKLTDEMIYQGVRECFEELAGAAMAANPQLMKELQAMQQQAARAEAPPQLQAQ